MKASHRFLIGFLAGLLLAGGIWSMVYRSQLGGIKTDQQANRRIIRIQVDGAVVNPGEYFLDEDGRVMDALVAAGGLLPEADRSGINLAAGIYDMQKLEIPYISETMQDNRTNDDINIPREMDVVSDETRAPDDSSIIPTATACSDGAFGTGSFVWPAENRFLSGNDYSFDHPGIDIAAGLGSPVFAADSGMVRSQGNDHSAYGNVIEIDHGNGYSTIYAHLSVIGVEAGQEVCAGQWIGAAGSTGNSTGAHLHFGVLQDGGYINPWSVLSVP